MLHIEVALPLGKYAGHGLGFSDLERHAGDIYAPSFEGSLQAQIEPLRLM